MGLNKAFSEVRRPRNRGIGYGLEIACTYHLYGPPVYINRMKELVQPLIVAKIILTSSRTILFLFLGCGFFFFALFESIKEAVRDTGFWLLDGE